jgi:hypothetical protein
VLAGESFTNRDEMTSALLKDQPAPEPGASPQARLLFTAARCARIHERLERLACYDKLFPPEASEPKEVAPGAAQQ